MLTAQKRIKIRRWTPSLNESGQGLIRDWHELRLGDPPSLWLFANLPALDLRLILRAGMEHRVETADDLM